MSGATVMCLTIFFGILIDLIPLILFPIIYSWLILFVLLMSIINYRICILFCALSFSFCCC